MIARSFREAIIEMMEEIAKKIPNAHKKEPVKAYLTGGGAVHFYSNSRVSRDVDLILKYDIKVPKDLSVVWKNDEGILEEVYYDHTFNDTFGLFQEDYQERAIFLKSIDSKFEIYLLSPEDLIISKLTRFQGNDSEDIGSIIKTGKVNKERLIELATDAINVGVGFRPETVKIHLELVIEMLDSERIKKQPVIIPRIIDDSEGDEVLLSTMKNAKL